jgi:putative transposase
VYSRGALQFPVFYDRSDREMFLQLLAGTIDRWGWRCHSYCLMGNHYHLVVEMPPQESTLAKGMHRLNLGYALWWNRQTGRSGHAFDSRYGSILVETETHELELARYVVLNPVLAGICKSPEQWPWSSYRATLGLERRPRFLTTQRTLDRFGGNPTAYAKFVADRLAATTFSQTLPDSHAADSAVPATGQPVVTRP